MISESQFRQISKRDLLRLCEGVVLAVKTGKTFRMRTQKTATTEATCFVVTPDSALKIMAAFLDSEVASFFEQKDNLKKAYVRRFLKWREKYMPFRFRWVSYPDGSHSLLPLNMAYGKCDSPPVWFALAKHPSAYDNVFQPIRPKEPDKDGFISTLLWCNTPTGGPNFECLAELACQDQRFWDEKTEDEL